MIIKLGGALLDDAAALASICASVQNAARIAATQVVLVHGGGDAVDRRLRALGKEPKKIDGIRVTPEDQIDEVVATLAGVENAKLVRALAGAGVRAAGLTLSSAGVACSLTDASLGRVGKAESVDPAVLEALLASGCVPVLSSIGSDEHGALNVNADVAAAAVAAGLASETLALLGKVAGVLDGSGDVIPEVDDRAIASLVDAGTVSGGMVAKVRAALETSEEAGVAVTIASWEDLPALLNGGQAGTQIASGERRRRRATAGVG